MRRFEDWESELRYRVARIGNDGAGEDEKRAGGVYDMSLDIMNRLEEKVGRLWSDEEREVMVDTLYNAIKYGVGVE